MRTALAKPRTLGTGITQRSAACYFRNVRLVKHFVGNQFQRESKPLTFEDACLPHLGAAYNLARWLTRNEADAEDVVQEAYLRALKFFGAFDGQNGRPWLLTIVRNTG